MTSRQGGTRKPKTRSAWSRAQGRLRLQDLANTYACTRDESLLRELDRLFSRGLEMAERSAARGASAVLYVDGSYDEESGGAGIGIVLDTGGGSDPIIFGKRVRAASSESAEAYAIAVGLSFAMDTAEDLRFLRLKYDCAAAAVSAANLQAYVRYGAPYTNLRSAMKRLEKAGVSVVFTHVKAHAGNAGNGICDLVARYYSGAALKKEDRAAIERLLPDKKPRPQKIRKGGMDDA